MTLAELIARLEAADPTQVVKHGFTHPHSYRGYYLDLAFEPATDVPVAQLLACAQSALGATYQGYKGGEYTMDENTDCWLAEYGAVGETLGPLLMDLMLAVPSAVPAPAADRAAEIQQLRTENARMRHELEVMYGGAFDSVKDTPSVLAECDAIEADYDGQHDDVAVGARAAVMRIRTKAVEPVPAADRAGLREQIAEALRPGSRDRSGQYPEGLMRDVDAVLSVLPASVDRAAEEAYRLALSTALRLSTGANWEAIRDRAEDLVAEVQQLNQARVRQTDGAASVDRATVLNEAARTIAADAALRETEGEYSLAEYGYELARLIRPEDLRRMAVEARDGQTTQDEAPQGVARQRVEYFLQSREADGVWEDSSGFMVELDYAAERLAKRRNLVPGFEYRIAQRTTTVSVQPLPDCLNCRHWMCNGDGPCGALLDSWQRCTCTGPAGGAQQPKEA